MVDYNRLLDPAPIPWNPWPFVYGFLCGVIFSGATLVAVEWWIK